VDNGPEEERVPYLPSGYRLDELSERGFVILRRPDGSEAAAYSALGTNPKEMERRAWEDFRGRQGWANQPTSARRFSPSSAPSGVRRGIISERLRARVRGRHGQTVKAQAGNGGRPTPILPLRAHPRGWQVPASSLKLRADVRAPLGHGAPGTRRGSEEAPTSELCYIAFRRSGGRRSGKEGSQR
jgi:hypothetical protein